MNLTRVSPDDDLAALCAQLQPELWGEDNDLAAFNPDHLRRFLNNNGILLLAFEGDRIIGQAMCYTLPYIAARIIFTSMKSIRILTIDAKGLQRH